MAAPLMPKATAVWLVDNTSLTFDQIAEYCGLHRLEVQGIADGEVAIGIQGIDPIANSQLTRDEIERCENHPELRESQIAKLIGTTKTTIQAVNERTHWNSPNIRPRDPVLLGLCAQSELNAAVDRARKRAERLGEPIPEPVQYEGPIE